MRPPCLGRDLISSISTSPFGLPALIPLIELVKNPQFLFLSLRDIFLQFGQLVVLPHRPLESVFIVELLQVVQRFPFDIFVAALFDGTIPIRAYGRLRLRVTPGAALALLLTPRGAEIGPNALASAVVSVFDFVATHGE